MYLDYMRDNRLMSDRTYLLICFKHRISLNIKIYMWIEFNYVVHTYNYTKHYNSIKISLKIKVRNISFTNNDEKLFIS